MAIAIFPMSFALCQQKNAERRQPQPAGRPGLFVGERVDEVVAGGVGACVARKAGKVLLLVIQEFETLSP